jgi:hypothetical protein
VCGRDGAVATAAGHVIVNAAYGGEDIPIGSSAVCGEQGTNSDKTVIAKAEASDEELAGMIERGELRLPEMQRQYVWRSTRVRDRLESLYCGYPSGAILLWETDKTIPLQECAISHQRNPFQSMRLQLDGQQCLTSLSAVIRGEPVKVRGRKRPHRCDHAASQSHWITSST